MAEINDKYLNGAGLRTFVNYLNDTWWTSRKSELQDTYLPLAGGTITGQLNINSDTVTQDILPKTTDTYNLGSPGTGVDDGKMWAGIYAVKIEAEELKVTGSIKGTSDSSKKTDGALSFGIYDKNETNNSAEIFSFDGSKNTFIRTNNGIGIVTSELENTYLFGHTNNISTGTNSESLLSFGDQIYIPKLSFDDHGHITEEAWAIYTLPSDADLQKDIKDLQAQVDKIDNEIGFGNIVVGDTTIAADSHQGTLTFEASGNLSITADAALDKIIISTTATTDDAITPENVGMCVNNYLGITASKLN